MINYIIPSLESKGVSELNLTVQEINDIAGGIVDWWKAKHPDYKPSHDGSKLAIDDQYERNNYGQAVSCLVCIESHKQKIKVVSAKYLQASVAYQEQEVLKRLYDERTL